jgi:hypothetical protein
VESPIRCLVLRAADAFRDGVEEYAAYLRSLKGKETTFSGGHLRSIIDSFGSTLHQHLTDEISSLLALSKYGDKVHLNKLWDKQSVGNFNFHSAMTRIPFYLTNLDRTFEGGMWKDFPDVPRVGKYIMGRWVSRLNSRYWKFASCTWRGEPKQLYVSGKVEVVRK